ncbi:hypothetical protein ASG12_06170 [Williamsia sp. Leaf354]|uniref:hypothetical protein n=1 Tax=Williamsia sp. Leaf354 TaxID=1736349 RepID=UPI0006FBB2AD|nr:hypothetical protein [Williamsia sp. Leaf354]KQS00482.1 hypothetical protein ASG12_06170 [Williamsia sp. Leaf354]
MADGDKIDVNTEGLHAASKKILELGDSTDNAVADGSGLSGLITGTVTGGKLTGFATDGPLRRIPGATADAGHTLAGRFYVLGELVSTAADKYQAGDTAAARAINTAGYLNDPGSR